MMTNTTLTAILNEKDVENLYRQYLTKKFGDIVFNSPFGCDGYGESKKHNVRILCEFKDDLDLSSKVNQVKVLSQVLYYIKKFEVSGKILPSVILIGDRNECFAIHTNEIFNYLGMDFNWSMAPSNAHTNIELVTLMMEDVKINPHVFNIKDIANCVDKIKDLTDGVKRFIPITPHNVTEVFKHFEDNVIGSHKLDTNQLANLFVQLLVNPDENYLHPVSRRKTVVTKAFHEVNLKSREVFESFFSHFSREYTPQQREHLTAVVDRLVQDMTRRKQGEFFTPTIWVDKAHEYIASVYGDDWKEKYIVWDPAWGTGNLTRDYKFKELYVSTLNYSDIQTAEQMGYNPEAVKFQYDFLNDDYDFLPKKLRDAIESGYKIIVLMNPPYATGASAMKKGKKGTGKTKINEEMSKNELGKAAGQLYAQFIYRLKNFNNISLAMFTKPTFVTGDGYSNFRSNVMSRWNYEKGFVMNAKDFEGVKKWPLTFTIWNSNLENITISDTYPMDILELKNFQIEKKEIKNFYNLDNQVRLNDYVKKLSLKIKKKTYPNLSSALVVSNAELGFSDDFLGYMNVNGNSIQYNNQLVGLYSAPFAGGSNGVGHSPGFCLDKQNFNKSMMMFAARNTIKSNWLIEKDEYMVPNIESMFYKQFEKDALIISLFNNSSQQSSLRQITYKEENWNIKNQFFWLSKNEMTELANQNNYNELYNDARTDSDRYVHTLLFGDDGIYNQLSDEAKDVLNSATTLVRLSFGMRRNFADNTNHLNSWDAGYAQLKLLWKEYYPEQFKEFRGKYKVLEDKMRPLVYELGFLKK
jgi:hypothetical protein